MDARHDPKGSFPCGDLTYAELFRVGSPLRRADARRPMDSTRTWGWCGRCRSAARRKSPRRARVAEVMNWLPSSVVRILLVRRWLLRSSEAPMKRNEGAIDRVARVALGVALLALVFVGPRTWLGLVGLVPLLTGIVGFCPLYRLLRTNTVRA